MAEREVVVLGRYSDLAEFYVNEAAREAGTAATEVATSRKDDKYAGLDSRYLFETIRPSSGWRPSVFSVHQPTAC